MNTTLIIDGGLGRTICSIPALEKFVTNNPDTTIVTYFWTEIFVGNKILGEKVFDSQTKGLYDRIKDTKIIKPEPYYNNNYLNERTNMIGAWNEEINGDQEEMPKPNIHLSKIEMANVKNRINGAKKTIVFQPFGSGAYLQDGVVLDQCQRSLSSESAMMLYHLLNKANFQVILFDTKGFFDKNSVDHIDDLHFRQCAAVIKQADYFFGVDSCGQHMAHALEKPGTVIHGSTSSKSFGYPDWFSIIEKETEKPFMHLRLAEYDVYAKEMMCDGIMEYTKEDVEEMCQFIIEDVKEKT